MSAPRQILPDGTYLLTRRTAYRQFLLRPDEDTNQIFDFCLAYSAAKYDIDLLAWKAMSNHYHAVVHDKHTNICKFIEYFHRLFAKVLNAKWERRENVWSVEEACVTRLDSEADILDKVAYVLANPASAHLVEKSSEWPGASALPYLDGKKRVIDRPDFYFSPTDSVVDPSATLVAVLPPGTKLSRATYVAEVMKRVRALEAKAATKRRKDRRLRVVGVKAVLATRPTDTPSSKHKKSKLRPRIGCRDKKRRIELLMARKQFELHYYDARQELFEGVAQPIFPRGTLTRSGYPPPRIGDRPPHPPEVLRRHLSRLR